MIVASIATLPHSTWLFLVVAAGLLGLFLAYKLGSLAGFVVKNVVALAIFAGAVFFLAPVFLGHARGVAFQDKVRQALHISQAKSCAKSAGQTRADKAPAKLAACAKGVLANSR